MLDKIKIIADHYTKEEQSIQSIEEMSELIKELTKNINRGKDNREEIKSEIADVEIMMKQLLFKFGISQEEVDEVKRYKIERQMKRISEANYGDINRRVVKTNA
jgi:NTP pyrophosphatase (non-canonical NTP hydrolase)